MAFADLAFKSTDLVSGTVLRLITITGNITSSDVQAYKSLRKSFKTNDNSLNNSRFDLIVSLNSNGGDVNAAIELGELFRADEAATYVDSNEHCYSSCVFLLAAGVERRVKDNASIGIHRPYKTIDNATTVKQQKLEQAKTEKLVKSYLLQVNISTNLHDDMVRISPEHIKILTQTEMNHYGLNLNDPYFEDAKTVQLAKSQGLTTKEYRERKVRYKEYCWSLLTSLDE